MADTRSPQKRAADDALAREPTLTITPELWIRGVQVDAAAFGAPPYTLTRRTFASAAEERAAKAGYDAMCADGCAPEKAYRVWLCEEGAGPDEIRRQLLAKFGL